MRALSCIGVPKPAFFCKYMQSILYVGQSLDFPLLTHVYSVIDFGEELFIIYIMTIGVSLSACAESIK